MNGANYTLCFVPQYINILRNALVLFVWIVVVSGCKTSSYPVDRIVDGDTVVLLIDGKKTKVRLIGVDTPETVHPRRPVEYYGPEASQFMKDLLTGRSVWLEYETKRTDRYGRTLAYLYLVPDSLFVNLEIIRLGYGRTYTKYSFRYKDRFITAERTAQDAQLGLWRPQ
ncbi:MAG: thermonuclease family protein [Candidatus Electryoneaceae bacterium]|nr:thermonuclease family protein [Candidatus Electryoneaceae bacterium]